MSQTAQEAAIEATAQTPPNQGITKDFFTRPILVPCTLRGTVIAEDGSVQFVEHKGLFEFNRQKRAQVEKLAKQRETGETSDDKLRLSRLAALLAKEPQGFGDFPMDDRSLEDRALEYFGGLYMDEVVLSAMVEYDKSIHPLEYWKRF